jgi:hypothetical protein
VISVGSATETGGQESATIIGAGSTSTTTLTGPGSSGSGSSSGSGIGATVDNLGLSVGAIIGIAVAGGCIFILLILAIWLCCRRQSRRDPRYAAPYPVGGSYGAALGNPGYAPQQGGGYEGQGLRVEGNAKPGVAGYTPLPAPYREVAREYKNPVVQAEMGHDESRLVEMPAAEQR